MKPRHDLSDQGDDLPLRLGVGLDVSGGRPQAGMTGKRLNVAQTAADLAYFAGRASDETSPARMAGTADHTETSIYRRWNHTTTAAADRPRSRSLWMIGKSGRAFSPRRQCSCISAVLRSGWIGMWRPPPLPFEARFSCAITAAISLSASVTIA